jgi:hypothetical protein
MNPQKSEKGKVLRVKDLFPEGKNEISISGHISNMTTTQSGYDIFYIFQSNNKPPVLVYVDSLIGKEIDNNFEKLYGNECEFSISKIINTKRDMPMYVLSKVKKIGILEYQPKAKQTEFEGF